MSTSGDRYGAGPPHAVAAERVREPAQRSRTETWHRGGEHPTSEGPSSGVALGETSAGPLVRPYTMTRGRTRPSTGPRLDLVTIVVAARTQGDPGREPEHEAILRLCRRPISVAEISARLDIPLTVVRVLLGDLLAEGDVRTRATMTRLPEKKVLQAVLDGIRRL